MKILVRNILPSRRRDETKPEFISRCMGHPESVKDFPDRGQRFAVCESRSTPPSGNGLRRLQIRLPRGDPTRTARIARQYTADLERRWREVNRILRQLVLTDDVLGLGTPPRAFLQFPIPGRFDFPADIPGKAAAFDRFMRGLLDAEVLELSPISGLGSGWQNKYVRASYSVGVTHADAALRDIGISTPPGAIAQTLNAPIHVEKLELLFSRNFSELRGITDATAQQLSRIVTTGLATGQSPRIVAREITRSINTISRNRSLMLARTETIRAHSTATLTRFQQSGITTVQGFAEFATAADERVCRDCQDLEGRRFTLEEASNIIPVHPNCRCVWLPVLDNRGGRRRPSRPRKPFQGFLRESAAAAHLASVAKTLAVGRKRAAVADYTDGKYRAWNSHLRGIDGPLIKPGDLTGIGLVDDVLRTAPKTSQSVQVWRGTNGKGIPDLSVGDIMIDPGFVSTTTSLDTAAFFSRDLDGVFTMYKIGVPKGNRGLWMDVAVDTGLAEQEFLLASGSRFRVVGKQEMSGTRFLKENPDIRLGRQTGGAPDDFRVIIHEVMLEP